MLAVVASATLGRAHLQLHFLFHNIGSLPGLAFLPLEWGVSGQNPCSWEQNIVDKDRSMLTSPACHPPESCLSCLFRWWEFTGWPWRHHETRGWWRIKLCSNWTLAPPRHLRNAETIHGRAAGPRAAAGSWKTRHFQLAGPVYCAWLK